MAEGLWRRARAGEARSRLSRNYEANRLSCEGIFAFPLSCCALGATAARRSGLWGRSRESAGQQPGLGSERKAWVAAGRLEAVLIGTETRHPAARWAQRHATGRVTDAQNPGPEPGRGSQMPEEPPSSRRRRVRQTLGVSEPNSHLCEGVASPALRGWRISGARERGYFFLSLCLEGSSAYTPSFGL